MPRYRSTIRRTEEEKRNLKVDLRRIPEWEAELESIRDHFRRFNLSQIVSAASLVLEMRRNLAMRRDFSLEEYNQPKFERWKNTLTVDRLIRLTRDYSVPDFFLPDNVTIVGKIRSVLYERERDLASCKTHGVTDSYWVSVFTSKLHVDQMKLAEERTAQALAWSREIPRIEDALRLLSEVHSESLKFADRMSQIEKCLSLAAEKQAAIERFEAKHGRAFAKAAAADNQTRSRATSLKRLVKKTKDCPYCGADLDANPHLDHIYPVSKGGLSIVVNLVWCCSTCNGLKTDKGLMQFLKERGVSIDEALSRLHSLGKHV
ncbi:MAG: HNH endonuclease [Nitrospirota bacterium]